MSTMLFPDPRMRSPTAMGAYGAVFCDELNVALAELSNVLEQADAAGLYNDPVVVSAHAVYDDRSSYAVYVGFLGDACHKDATEVSTTAEKVRALVQQRAGMYVPPLRPDYVAPSGPNLNAFPVWGYAIVGVVGVVAVAYITGQTASLVRLFKSKKVSGYRRNRRHR